MAEKRLHTVEKKLMQDEKLAQAYQSVVDDNLSKGYIREVPEDEPNHHQNGSFHISPW